MGEERVKDKCKVFGLNGRKDGVSFNHDREGCWVEQVWGLGESQESGFTGGKFEVLLKHPVVMQVES